MAFLIGRQLMIVRKKVYWKRHNTNDVCSNAIRYYLKVEVVKATTSFQSNVQLLNKVENRMLGKETQITIETTFAGVKSLY